MAPLLALPTSSVIRMLRTSELFEELLAYLPVPDIASMKQTCGVFSAHADDAMRHRWTTTLCKWVNDAGAFRELLCCTGSIVSGSAALAYAMSATTFMNTWTPMDMDVYCSVATAVSVVDWFVRTQSYTYLPAFANVSGDVDDEAYFMEYHGGIAGVVHLTCSDGRSVDIICSKTPSPMYPLPHFWGTLVLNYLTADSLVVAYPQLTFE
ncbi:hypothetical protein OF83DRAFT_1176814, partial [Amylostereum chailletii]